MTRLRILLGIHLLFFALWGGWLVASHRGAREVWLSTSPVDPRDLLSGHFVALRFEQLETGPGCQPGVLSDTVFLRLEPSGQMARTVEGEREIWGMDECLPVPPSDSDGRVWVRGSRETEDGPFRFGIEKFFVPEGSPLRSARSGDVIAKIAVNDAHEARLLGLIALQKEEK